MRSSLIFLRNASKRIKLPDGRVAKRPPSHNTLNGYALYLRETYKNEKASLQEQYPDFSARSSALNKRWRALSEAERDQFRDRAKHIAVVAHKDKPVKLHGWKAYIKANYSSVKHLPFNQRLKTLRESYANEKTQQ